MHKKEIFLEHANYKRKIIQTKFTQAFSLFSFLAFVAVSISPDFDIFSFLSIINCNVC